MKQLSGILTVVLIAGLAISSHAQQQPESSINLEKYHKELVSSSDLAGWDFFGMGKAFESGGGSVCLTENDSTAGVVLVSPKSYTGDVIVSYKALALTSATVLVFMHSASDVGSDKLTIPADYNGNMGMWTTDKDNYFHAFRNEAHNFPPFIRKYPFPGGEALALASENVTLPGVFYDIEIGRIGHKLWLSVDGQKIIKTVDESILPGGHLVFRVRGTAGFKAACLIKEVEIYSEKP